jgi:hypothetical protein
MLSALAQPWWWWILSDANTITGTGLFTLMGYAGPLILIQLIQDRSGNLEVLLRWPAWARGVAYAVVFYGFVLFGGAVDKPFIYFQF